MPFPILLKLAAGGAALFLLSNKKHEQPVAAPTSMPIPERMARVLQTNDPNAIRFEAGRLKQEGHPAEAAQLEQAAKTIEAEIAAGKKPAPVYPSAAPPAAPTGPLTQPSAGPLPPGSVTSAGVPQVRPPAPGVVLPLPLLGPGEVLHYMPPPAPYDPRVQAWQTKLLSLGLSVGPSGADGKFGADTRDATRLFQTRANAQAAQTGQALILVNGMLDAPTLARAALVFALPVPGKPAAPVTVPVVVPHPVAAAPVVHPSAPPPPVVQTTPTGPAVAVPPHVAVLPASAPLPLPVLASGEYLTRVHPGQTYSAKTLLWQNKLVSLGMMKPTDAIGKYGPTTETATRSFQTQANKYLASQKKPAISVDGEVGPQTLGLAALAHPPGSGGALWGALMAPPMAATPLPGVMPLMMPDPIDPRFELAARLYDNLLRTGTGAEDRNLVQLFQAQQGLRASGYYQPGTALALARLGIVPPVPRYWPSTGRGKAKRNYQRELLQFAARDPQRKEEWEIAAR